MRAPHKEGYVREDGLVFWRNHKIKGPIWLTAEAYERRKAQRLEYRRKCLELYRQMNRKRNVMDKPYFGKYDFASNKYYVGISASGKEVWLTREKFEHFKKQHEKCKKRYVERAKALPPTNLKVGDPHPEKPDIYVIFKIGNKVFFGTKERLERRRESLKRTMRKRNIKCQKIRRDLMSKLDKKVRRGTVDEATGLVFWIYDRVAKPVWLTKEEFEARKAKEKAKKLRQRQRRQVDMSSPLSLQASTCKSTASPPVSG